MTKKEWKNKFLSSSLPLEFEVGKILKLKKFGISYDYTYSRDKCLFNDRSDKSSDVYTDFSVDLHAWDFAPFNDDDKFETAAWLQLLVECKYVHPNKKWLFLPDINITKDFRDKRGNSLHYIDRFSKKFLELNATDSFDKRGPFCYKGTEIELDSGCCDEYPVLKGISQLQYALPRLICDYIENCSDDNQGIPLLFCPILVTTADLMVLNRKVTIKDVYNSTDLTDIAKSVPYLFLHSDCGPDFEKHCAKQCKELRNLEWPNLSKYRLDHGESEWLLPDSECLMLSEGGRGLSYFSSFVVCSLINFPIILQKIKQITTSVIDQKETK